MASVLVDTNLLVLLVVGLTSKALIGRHKRTSAYDEESFSRLTNTLERFTEVIVTPHILAETSNLIRQCPEPTRTDVGRSLSELITETLEHASKAEAVVQHPQYLRIGLTDAGILEAQASGATLLTDDLALYLTSSKLGYEAINFAHLRDS